MTDDIGKILADAFAYGTGFAVGGKHVPFEDVYLDPRDAAQSTCQRSYNEGAADERAKIVAWLRGFRWFSTASAIEAGEHLK